MRKKITQHCRRKAVVSQDEIEQADTIVVLLSWCMFFLRDLNKNK